MIMCSFYECIFTTLRINNFVLLFISSHWYKMHLMLPQALLSQVSVGKSYCYLLVLLHLVVVVSRIIIMFVLNNDFLFV